MNSSLSYVIEIWEVLCKGDLKTDHISILFSLINVKRINIGNDYEINYFEMLFLLTTWLPGTVTFQSMYQRAGYYMPWGEIFMAGARLGKEWTNPPPKKSEDLFKCPACSNDHRRVTKPQGIFPGMKRVPQLCSNSFTG